MFRIISLSVIYGGAFASFVGTYVSVSPGADLSSWHLYWMIGAAAFTFIAFVFDVAMYLMSRPKRYRGRNKDRNIIKYMRQWLCSGGRAVIFSRDMSWGNDEYVKPTLINKSKNGELLICIQSPTPLTDLLKQNGAEVYTYAHLSKVPSSRFTIVNYEKHGAKVAVGLPEGNDHVIQEYQKGVDPFFSVAEDLVKYVIAARAT